MIDHYTKIQHQKALEFHPMVDGRAEAHEAARAAVKTCVAELDQIVPPSREASLAFTAMQEALMWANAAIAIHYAEPENE